MEPTQLIIPASVVTLLGGVYFIARNAVATYRAANSEYMPRAECVLKHEGESQHVTDLIDQRKRSSHDLRNELQRVVSKVDAMALRTARSEERQRWIVAALGSLMQKVGANGVPPPPAD